MKPCYKFGIFRPNVTYKAEGCGDLPTIKEEKYIISAWELEPGDLEKIQKTGVVYLAVMGQGQPPVYLSPSVYDAIEVSEDATKEGV